MNALSGGRAALSTDLYQLAMAQAYLREGLTGEAAFELFVRDRPPRRNLLLFCGLDPALEALASLRFDEPALAYLATLGRFREPFLDYLRRFRFRGSVRAMPEGTPFFPGEPVLEVRAALPEAQIAETLLMSVVHAHTVLASKALRIVLAARSDGRDRPVVDFGLRRAHGPEAGLALARAAYVAGASGTSNLLAGRTYGIPVFGTMAHSYVQAHPTEEEAFRAFAELYPETTLLVDTYDPLAAVETVIRLARAEGPRFRIGAIRLDSGDLASLARRCRARLDSAGLQHVSILASGGLDEDRIARLVRSGAPIDGFGVGTRMAVGAGAPALEFAYKLVVYEGRPRFKLSRGKSTLPGRKQVYRRTRRGSDLVETLAAPPPPGAVPLLRPVMERGERLAPPEPLAAARERAAAAVAALPPRLRELGRADPPYPVEIGPALARLADRLTRGRRD